MTISEDNFHIPKRVVKDLIIDSFNKSETLIDDALVLTKNEGNSKTILGLLIYSLEEIGKALLLKERLNGQFCNVEKWIFGKGKPTKPNAHQKRINASFKNIPNKCKQIIITTELEVYVSDGSKPTKIVKKGSLLLTLASGLTGLFSTESEKLVDLDFDTKMECFHVDFSEGYKFTIKDIDHVQLLDALLELKLYVENQKEFRI